MSAEAWYTQSMTFFVFNFFNIVLFLLALILAGLGVLIYRLVSKKRSSIFQLLSTATILLLAYLPIGDLTQPWQYGRPFGINEIFFLIIMAGLSVGLAYIFAAVNSRINQIAHAKLAKAAIILIILPLTFVFMSSYAQYPTRSYTSFNADEVVPMSEEQVDARRDRIESIYSGLNLDESYTVSSEKVSGKKVLYSWDKGRSYSSSRIYKHDADVDKTAKELRTKIEASGFKFIDEPYAGSNYIQYHFKSEQSEYVRLTVSSIALREAQRNREDISKIDANLGPVQVTIKVNLDDNNE
jgi:hypothetical protein